MTPVLAKERASTLLSYFKDLPQEQIYQGKGRIYTEGERGCFGAHVAFALNSQREEKGMWSYHDGADDMRDIIESASDCSQFGLFTLYGVDFPYAGYEWERRPYDVLCDIFDHIGLVEKNGHAEEVAMPS